MTTDYSLVHAINLLKRDVCMFIDVKKSAIIQHLVTAVSTIIRYGTDCTEINYLVLIIDSK